jgi:hypothetical protein
MIGTAVQCTDFWDRNRGASSDSYEGVFADKKAEISLCYFSKDEYAVKEFLRSP